MARTAAMPNSPTQNEHPAPTINGPAPSTKSPQVVLWGLIGAVCVTVVLAGWGRWILSNDFTRTPPGPDPISGTKLVVLRVVEVASAAGGIVLVGWFLIRPWWRERRLTLDGMMIIALLLAWFWDPLANYFNYSFVYNTHALNFGSWVRFIPGWEYPGAVGHFAEPLWVAGAWVWWCFGGSILCCALLRSAGRRWPGMSNLGKFAVLAAAIVVIDLLLECLFLRTEVMAWAGAPRSLSLWAGHYYQFPLLESPFVVSLMGGITAVRYFRDDRGQSFVERGVERFRRPKRGRSFVSLLAVTGYIHTVVIVGYNLPLQYVALKADTFPALASYLRAGTCGRGTDYACPSGAVPIPSRGSLHVAPNDLRLPQTVRQRQGRSDG